MTTHTENDSEQKLIFLLVRISALMLSMNDLLIYCMLSSLTLITYAEVDDILIQVNCEYHVIYFV